METISKKTLEHLVGLGYKIRLDFIEVVPGFFQVEVKARGEKKILTKGKHRKIEPQLISETGILRFAKRMASKKEIRVKFLGPA